MEAYRENDEKFRIINNLSKEIQTAIAKKEMTCEEIKDIYEIVFKNFSTEKIKTPLKVSNDNWSKKDEKNYVVFVNREGLSANYHTYTTGNTSNISQERVPVFVSMLKQVKENINQILPSITKEKKQELLNSFLEDIELLKFMESKIKEFETPIELVINDLDNEKENLIMVKFLKATPREVGFDYTGEWNWESRRNGVNINSISLRDKMLIEQIYEEIKLLLEEYLQDETENLKNAELFLEKLKDKFSAQLVINELKTTNK